MKPLKSPFALYTLLLLFFCVQLQAQQPTPTPQDLDAKREKVEALRVAYITKKLNLTPQEAQVFWPIYNEYTGKLEKLRTVFRKSYNRSTNYDFATDQEAEAYINAEINLKQKEYELFKEYFTKFKKVLPIKKVATLRRAEEEFKKEIIKTIKASVIEQPQ